MSLKSITKLKQNFPVMTPDDTVMSAIKEMIDQESGVVLIADADNRLLGLFSERDVMVQIAAHDRDAHRTLLSDVMSTDLITIRDTADSAEAIQTMVDGRIRHLPVVAEDNSIVGLISLRYLLHDRIRELAEELDSLSAYLNDAPGG